MITIDNQEWEREAKCPLKECVILVTLNLGDGVYHLCCEHNWKFSLAFDITKAWLKANSQELPRDITQDA